MCAVCSWDAIAGDAIKNLDAAQVSILMLKDTDDQRIRLDKAGK
jgi:hypothetical protein